MTVAIHLSTKLLFQVMQEQVYQYRKGLFRLASGRSSHDYFNCKKITMVPHHLALLARVLRDDLIPREKLPLPKAAGGLTLGADPLAYALSLAYLEKGHCLYPVIVRKETKRHGMAKRVEAEFDRKAINEVLLLEDTLTTGGSALTAARALREEGFQVSHCISIVDREEGGKENLRHEGIKLLSLFTKHQFRQPIPPHKKVIHPPKRSLVFKSQLKESSPTK